MIWDDYEIVIETGDGATLLSPESTNVIIELGVQEALNYTRTVKNVVNDEDAATGDEFKLIMIDASLTPVTYTIDPALFTGLTLWIRVKDATFEANVAAETGTIQLKNSDDQTSLPLAERQTIELYSDGTNLIEV